jgi:hypothetical protein
MTSDQTQDTRTAAEVLIDAMDEWGFGDMTEGEADQLLVSLADAGYTIAGPGQVVIDAGRAHRLWEDAYSWYSRWEPTCIGCYAVQPGDLDPLDGSWN